MTDLLKAHTMSRALAEDLTAAFYLDSASQPMHRKEKLALAERHLRETAEALGYRVEKVDSPPGGMPVARNDLHDHAGAPKIQRQAVMSATNQDGMEDSCILFAPRNDLSVLMQVIEVADKPCGVTPDGTWLFEKRELSRNAAGQLCERPL